ncbi:MAG: shikimate dehydrogenase, partial [Rhodanobacter sp.]
MPAAQFAVFGHPIGHSLSPQIHRAFAQQFGIELEYRAIDVAPAGFAAAVQRFFADGGRGANVTLPHKAAAFALADERS